MGLAPTAFGPYRSARQIMWSMCRGTEVTPEDILGGSRLPHIVEIRNRVAKTLHGELHWGLSRIGRYLHKDHSTIWHAMKKPWRDLESLPPLPRSIPPKAELPTVISADPATTVVAPGTIRPSNEEPSNAMDADGRRQLARLLFIHGPNCFRRFNIDTSMPRKILQDPSRGYLQGNEHTQLFSCPKQTRMELQRAQNEFAGSSSV